MTNINSQSASQINNYEIIVSDNWNSEIKVKESFLKEIDAINFMSSTKDLTLNNTFVWPDFILLNSDWSQEEIKWNNNLFFQSKNNCSIIKGISLSWKTTIWIKIFFDSIAKKMTPLILNWINIVKWSNDFNKLVKKEFEYQYNGDFEAFKNSKNNILIVDNFHEGISWRFINFAKSNFMKIIFLLSEDEYLSDFQKNEDLIWFNVYSIKFFNKQKQQDLICNWLKKESYDVEELFDKTFDEIEEKINDITTINHIVPRTPFYILSIIQSFDNFSTNNVNISSYWHCYETLFRIQLFKKWIDKASNVNACINFLKELAYNIFNLNNNKTDRISLEDYKQFKDNYLKEYLWVNSKIIDELEDSNYPIIKKVWNNIFFEFKYIYYYFVWMYISEITIWNNYKEIKDLCDTIYKQSSSNILTFVVHHTNNINILTEIQLHCMMTFEKKKVTELTKNDTDFMNGLLKELPDSIMSSQSVSEYRKEKNKLHDLNDEHYRENDFESKIEWNSELIEFNKSFKVIEVLWQIIKNRSWNLKADKVEELLYELEVLGLRITTYIVETIDSDSFKYFIKKWIETIEEEKKEKNKNMTDNDKKLTIEKISQLFAMQSIHWMLLKIFYSVNIENLLEIQKRISFKHNSPAFDLILLLFKINFDNIDIEYIRKLYKKYNDESNLWIMRSITYFLQLYLNNHSVDYRLKQQLNSEFEKYNWNSNRKKIFK